MAEFKREEFIKEFGPLIRNCSLTKKDREKLIIMVNEEFQVGDITIRQDTPEYEFSLDGIYYGMLVDDHGYCVCQQKPMDYLHRETPYNYSPYGFLLYYRSVTKHTRERIEVWQNLKEKNF